MVLSDEPSPRVHPCSITLLIEPLPLEISPLCPVGIKALNPYHTQPKSTGTNWHAETSQHHACSWFSEQLYIIIAHGLGQREGKKGKQHLTCKPEGWCACWGTKNKTLQSTLHSPNIKRTTTSTQNFNSLIVRHPGWQTGMLSLNSSSKSRRKEIQNRVSSQDVTWVSTASTSLALESSPLF